MQQVMLIQFVYIMTCVVDNVTDLKQELEELILSIFYFNE